MTKISGVYGCLTLGVLAGWQFYWTATPPSYLNPIFRGTTSAARDLGCNLLLICGMGTSATPTDPLRPAWPELAPDSDFVPIGPWNTDGLIAVNPLDSAARLMYLQDLIAGSTPQKPGVYARKNSLLTENGFQSII
ncbi:MAG: hypothetical protein HY870_14390 [Chloroflexi bacterium]|nr:hypothetical protein [Chloroflexota bacterium]